MSYLDNIQASIDFIESNIDSELSVPAIAREAGLSQWHFQRIFKALTNETLKRYIRSRRLANALHKLSDTDERIIDIALAAGFESQESFSRAFKKAFDMTPGDARRRDARHFQYRKLEINTAYLRHLNQHVTLEPQIVVHPRRLFVGLETTFYSVDSERNNIAEQLPALWGAFVPRMAEIVDAVPEKAYGIIQQTEEKTDRLRYAAVCEVPSSDAHIPADMQLLTLPETRYARFAHHGETSLINNTVNYIYSNWLLQSQYQHNLQADIEEYGREFQPDSPDSTIYYLIPLR
ncbi:MAG TPA: AraC family transcriptional regulator [Gammaproteobacteria bacterium]|nr:AraC family transcriptional regulator [Gammaproteobacteria bacterium]